MQRGFLKKFVIIQGLLVILLLSAVFYVYTRPQKQPEGEKPPQSKTVITDEQNETAAADSTASWKTHTDEYGFSFKYPKDFSLDISRPVEYSENFPLKVIVVFPPYESANTIEFSLIKGIVKKSPSDEICQSIDTKLNAIPAIKRSCGDARTSSVSYSIQLKNGIALSMRIANNESPESKIIPQEITNGIVSSLTISQ
ncbi:MAG: hypothetical protein A2131_02445 [Candidatus Sungbacteria bacterium GWC2_49_10]|uniref:Uncharacterized protein n=2 Tax=Parcubacteria group TaxID=1794811 RepID=A0A0G1WS88_9BACT|nr:MAG: hypothetical protein UY60_C0004G0013 [Parcubacteria group bacterium GW2011_GWB1_50_9]KKW21626.1 MAG: hypothetical protein UY61_C0002G0010 [Candidatus Adlerbacteria bacterium GW2011_GWC1_50_9]OGZ94479.1 MAG: hypothetical protein A2131_02445 [Candidatus Sungbacteria bacterium GWC2_49_10]